jgi:RuvA, C-terminal domain
MLGHRDMTARAATVSLYVTFVSLVAAMIALATAVVRLVVAGVTRLTASIEVRTAGAPRDTTSRPALRLVHPRPATAAAPTSAPVAAPSNADRLQHGLVNLGFKLPEVRAFVTSLGDRAEREPLPALIREGLAALGSRAVAS